MNIGREYTLEEKQIIGKFLASFFGMRPTKDGRYVTGWGDKTEIGLYETFMALHTPVQMDMILEDAKHG